jgi:ferredoxin
MTKVIFHSKEKTQTFETQEGVSILELALTKDIPLYHTCGGNCSCSTCRVLVLKGSENLSPMEGDEALVLDAFDLTSPHRLGCQARVMKGEVEVEIPQRSKPPRANKTPPVKEGPHATY